MLLYQIRIPSVRVKHTAQLNNLILGESDEEVLARYLTKFPRFTVGDRVRFKKPKRRPIEGSIIHVEKNSEKVHFTNGIPQFLTIKLDEKNVINGIREVKANSKKLLYIGHV